ncbi:MAG TPA: hypothetical protein VMW17_04385 [Candidatus Binatia bacterium]|nr:hypothetical protein [Candidatus Binatia bacterium]
MQIRGALLVGLLVVGSVASAQAGWVIEQINVAKQPRGDAGPEEPATLRISEGRLRVAQPNIVTVQDCVKSRFIMFVPERNIYWSGSIDEYVSELRGQLTRSLVAGAPVGATPSTGEAPKIPTVNAAGLPKIVVRKTEEQAKIAGYDTIKYVIESDGATFQEVWLSTAINMNADLDPKKYLACQTKVSAGMAGASASHFNALYRSPDYLALLSSGAILKTITNHAAGSYTQEVRSVTRADIADNEFDVPTGATRASLNDLFEPVKR